MTRRDILKGLASFAAWVRAYAKAPKGVGGIVVTVGERHADMSASTDALRPEWERRARLYLEHPDESPELIGTLDYLIHPPGKLSATVSWLRFRDKTLLPMIRSDPDDPNLPNFLKQVEAVLAWRAQISQEERFWRKD